jgi:hypothetical protein
LFTEESDLKPIEIINVIIIIYFPSLSIGFIIVVSYRKETETTSLVVFNTTFLYYNVLNTCDMSRVLLVERKNSDKNQKRRDKIHNLVDKAYYADPIMYKMDNTMAYLDDFVTE